MLSLGKPEPQTLHDFLSDQAAKALSYAEVGATEGTLPSGYVINHTRIQLGAGLQTYTHACGILKAWQQLQLGWVGFWPTTAPIKTDENVVILGKALGLWWLNACRIVYTIDKSGAHPRFGYAHGTLPDHLASGEERFLIEMDAEAKVWFDILSFSRPTSWLARIGYPYLRFSQKRFGRESAHRVLELVRQQSSTVGAAAARTGVDPRTS